MLPHPPFGLELMEWTWRGLHPRGDRWVADTPHYATPKLEAPSKGGAFDLAD